VATIVAGTGQIVVRSPAEFARAIEEQLTAFTAIAKSLDQQPRR
jgi:hypothetical protein